MKNRVIYTFVVLMLVLMGWFSLRAYQEAMAYQQSTTQLVSHLGAKEQAENRLKAWAEKLSLGFYKNETQATLHEIQTAQRLHRSAAMRYTLYAILLLGGILGSYFLLSLRAFTLFGALGALIMLLFGLITPILMVTIHKEIEYLGDVVLSFESKGVIGSVSKLFESGDMVVAVVILLFSVIVPLIKILSLLFVSLFMQSTFAHGIVKFFKMIGKWSMVDVFVVATFLVYLGANKGDVSRAEVEVGLYFFLAYVIVSMLVSLSADRMLHEKKYEKY
ncbi:MAG: paraquat-inducible protein A [Sulfurovum sp.]|nr:MAG: paraquat-inducible protein A [Sulfurovum sp.]